MGSYFRHAGRYCLGTCCECLNFGLMAIMLKHPSDITVAFVKSFRDRCFRFNLDIEDKLRTGRTPDIFLAKFDVDGFFTNVKWPLFHRAMDWWLSQFSYVFWRKKYFAIPKDSSERAIQP